MTPQVYPQLDKSSRKYICPACNKKTFVLYRLPNNDIVHDTVGRCDREENCVYHYTPKQYYQDNRVDNQNWKPQQYVRQSKTKETHYIELKYIYKRANTRNSNFIYFLFNLFDWQTIIKTIDPYFIGCTTDMQTVFPQIDEQGKCRTAKIQQYNKQTGKRVKGAINWLHYQLKREKIVPNDFNLRMCLFGLHLIRSTNNKGKIVCICESEKSAVIASGYLPQYIWMASGALSWLNVDKLKPLKGWNIILFPDTSASGKAFDKWTSIAKDAQSIGLKITVSDLLENECTDYQKEQGYDIADYLIDNSKQSQDTNNEPTCLDQMIEQEPALAQLISVFDLEVLSVSVINP